MEKKITILYVEDDFAIQKKLLSELEYHADHVIVRDNGLQGLEVIQEDSQEVDLIITDIKMARMDGIEMAKEIRKLDKDIPIIFTTAHNHSNMLIESIKTEASAYILKPIDLDILENTILKIIANIKNKFIAEEHLQSLANNSQFQGFELNLSKKLIDENILYIKTDEEGLITHVSKEFCNKYRLGRSEIIGVIYHQLWSNHTDAKIIKNLKDAFLNKTEWNGDLQHTILGGGEDESPHNFYVNSFIKPIVRRGKLKEYEIIQKDITLKKTIDDLSEEQSKELMAKQLSSIQSKFRSALDRIGIDVQKLSKDYSRNIVDVNYIDNLKSNTMESISTINEMLYESAESLEKM